jgi:hypothetical protein
MKLSYFYLSECGQYICRKRNSGGLYEAWTRDGARHWRDDNRIKTWKQSAIPMHPMDFAVGGYSAEQTGQKKGSFTLNLLHCDVTKFVEPFRGNTIIESLDVVFRRKIPAQNIPHWLKDSATEPRP